MSLVGSLPLITWHGRYLAPKSLHLEELALPLPNVTPALAGLRIGFITDIHHEPHRPVALLKRAVELLNTARPDLVLLGGDYVDRSAEDFDRPLALLAQLQAPLGVFAILGNHDYWGGSDYLAARLAASGITVLRNESRQLPTPGGSQIRLIGVDSTVIHHDDLDAAYAGVEPAEFCLVLAHEPEAVEQILARGFRVDLQLSGHSHGGQIVLPGIGAPLLPRLGRRYVRGFHRDPAIYTSRGLGAVPPYLRYNADPEVTLLTLAMPSHNDQLPDGA